MKPAKLPVCVAAGVSDPGYENGAARSFAPEGLDAFMGLIATSIPKCLHGRSSTASTGRA
jgi:hypothetical protein